MVKIHFLQKVLKNGLLSEKITLGKQKTMIFYDIVKLDHFLRTFCKKCIFTIENPKK